MNIHYELLLLTILMEFTEAELHPENKTLVYCSPPGYIMHAISLCSPPETAPTADLTNAVFTPGSVCSVVCIKGYSFPDGSVLATQMCRAVFYEETDVTLLQWVPFVDHCGLYFKD